MVYKWPSIKSESFFDFFCDFLCAGLGDIKWKFKTLPGYPDFLEETPRGIIYIYIYIPKEDLLCNYFMIYLYVLYLSKHVNVLSRRFPALSGSKL